MMERIGIFKFKGEDVTIIGPDLKPGDKAPDFTAHALDWGLVKGISDTQGKVRIIASVPSLETDICNRETRTFNQEAASLGKDVIILVISMDLPYTQNRWCGASGVDRVMVLSDHLAGEFGALYGCLIKEVRVLRRAVFVVDQSGTIVYSAYMPVLGDEPNYPEILTAASSALDSNSR